MKTCVDNIEKEMHLENCNLKIEDILIKINICNEKLCSLPNKDSFFNKIKSKINKSKKIIFEDNCGEIFGRCINILVCPINIEELEKLHKRLL